MPRTRLAASLLAATLVLAACGGADDPAGPEASSPTGAPGGTEQAGGAGEPLDFTAPDVRGGRVVGSDFAGQDVVIWFWAPW